MDAITNDIFGKISEDKPLSNERPFAKQKRKNKKKAKKEVKKAKKSKERAKEAEKKAKSLKKMVKQQDQMIQKLSGEVRRETELRHEQELILAYIRGRFDSIQAPSSSSDSRLMLHE